MPRSQRTARRLRIAVVAVAALLLMPAPSQADEAVSTTPALEHPIVGAGAEVVVQVNAGPRTWRIRKTARTMDALVDGLTIRTSGDCATADMCVIVHVDHYDTAETLMLSEGYWSDWRGLTAYPSDRERVVYLNTVARVHRTSRMRTAAHEFGHVLGLAHHGGPGLMSIGPGRMSTLSDAELVLLRGWYGSPAA